MEIVILSGAEADLDDIYACSVKAVAKTCSWHWIENWNCCGTFPRLAPQRLQARIDA
jgi:hypothetical protein